MTDEEVALSSFQGTAVTRPTMAEEEEPLPIQPRRKFVFFPALIPQVLQEAIQNLDVTNRGVVWGRLASEDLLNPQWELEVQVRILEEEGDELLGLLTRDAAESRDNRND